MDAQDNETTTINDAEEEPRYPVKHSFAFASSTAVVMGLADWLAHFGPTGLVVGGLASYVAWKHGPELYEQVRGKLPRPVTAAETEPAQARMAHQTGSRAANSHKRSLLERALGIPAADRRDGDEDADTVLIDEDEGDTPLPDTLALGSMTPHADLVFSHRLVILGMPGAGKSNLVAVLVEELGQYDAPLIVFDHKPEYGPLCQSPYLTNPLRLSARNVTPQNAAALAQQLMAERWQAVLDLTSYSRDAEAAYVMTELIAAVFEYQKARDNRERIPCTFVLDEAHYWLPEQEGQSTIRGIKLHTGQSLLSYVQQAFFTLAKVGRTFGMGLVVATQRPADVDKRLISTADWRFLLQTLEPTDLKVYRGYGLPDEQAMALNPKRGEAYVIGPDGLRGISRIRRFSPDVAKAPGLDNIRAAGARERSPFPQARASERGNSPLGTFPGNTGTREKRPVERVETVPAYRESSPAGGNAGNAHEDEGTGEDTDTEGYSHEEETQVLLAYAELLRTGNGVLPSRRAIKEYLGWSSRQFSRVIKPVCDKHGIAVRES